MSEYLIIDKSILPDYFELVLKAKGLVEDEKTSVSDACKKTGISRSTFYKYKDKIFNVSNTYGKRAIITVKAADKKGVLSGILSAVYSFGANVVSINQAIPIKSVAVITLAVDFGDTAGGGDALTEKIKAIENVKNASIVAIE
ncbi:MAG: ACT domain-containing protein [Clostridia bacterium]|nr:ACT domain-containing protein [Clostridia bacterium]